MKPLVFLLNFFLTFLTINVNAQDNFLTFDLANGKDFEHGLGNVVVIDKRQNKSDTFGIIRSGKMNGKRPLLATQPLSKSIEKYFTDLSSKCKIPSERSLVMLIYKFDGNELSSGFTDENAEFTFAADYFISDNGNEFKLLGIVDTIIRVSSIDVTKKLLRTIDQSLCKLYEQNYDLQPKDKQGYTFEEIQRYDEIEKNSHAAFRADNFPNGAFATWEDFLELNYTESNKISKKKNKFKIAVLSESGKIKYNGVNSKTKVIAHEGKAYINFGNIFYPLSKMDNNFYFTGRLGEVQSNTGVIIGAGALLGTFGVLVIINTKEPPGLDGSTLGGILYDFKVEARTGKAILLGKAIRPQIPY